MRMEYNMLMHKRMFLVWARLFLGLATLMAVILQAGVVYAQGVFNPFNYLGYFTNISNIVAALILIISAMYLLKNKKPSPEDDSIRGAATLYMLVTGIVYMILLRGEDLGLLLPWVNILLHIIMPVAVIADWLYQPPLSKITARQAVIWLTFPIIFVIYTLTRGAYTGWYPYPFLNPDAVGGYGGVFAYSVGILLLFFVLGWFVIKMGRVLKRNIP